MQHYSILNDFQKISALAKAAQKTINFDHKTTVFDHKTTRRRLRRRPPGAAVPGGCCFLMDSDEKMIFN